MKYLLSIVLLALIGFTTPKKTIPAYDWGSVSAEPDLSWADQVGAQRTPENTEWDAGKFGLRNVRGEKRSVSICGRSENE